VQFKPNLQAVIKQADDVLNAVLSTKEDHERCP
jgi:hypothetical protein